MLLETFYKYEFEDDDEKVAYFYRATLSAWLIYNQYEIFENLLNYFTEAEEYLVCAGIHKAINRIEEIVGERFEDAAVVAEDEESVTYDVEEHKRVSGLIFQDILKEIYEDEIRGYKEGSRK